MSNEKQIGLPYQEITEVAKRDDVRKSYKRGRETMFIPFASLQVREGFNIRNEYKNIPELAESLHATGLDTPLTVDVLPDGTVFIEKGHRRLKAMQFLEKAGVLNDIYLGGLQGGMVECFVNRGEVSELTRIIRQYSSNLQDSYSTLDIADLCLRLKTFFELNNQEVAKNLGLSRQTVDNYVKLAQEPDQIRQAIKSGSITPTAAIDLIRKIKDSNERTEYVLTQKGTDAKISVSDVKNIGSKNIKTEVDEKEFDGEEDDVKEELEHVKEDQIENKEHADKEEAKLCQRVITNLDKVNTIIANVEPGLRKDIERLLDFCQKDMEQIHKYVKRKK